MYAIILLEKGNKPTLGKLKVNFQNAKGRNGMGKKWYEITFCAKWDREWVAGEYEIDKVFTQAETREQAKKWFGEFIYMFERDYPVEVLTYKISGGLPM